MTANPFSRIYRGNLWNGRESRSGPGSGMAPTRHVASWIEQVCDELAVGSVLDIGCGDSLWMPRLPGYLGIDVAPEAVERARSFHPGRAYEVHDARLDVPRGFALVIARDVIQHLSFADGLALLANVQRSGARWLIASTYTGPSERHGDPVNVDIRTGDCYSPDLTAPPFRMPQPWKRTPDGWDYETGAEVRDRSKWLGLWKLRP